MNEDFSQMIGKIMANPEFGNLVNQLKSSGLTDGKNEEAVPAAVVQDTGNPHRLRQMKSHKSCQSL